MLIVDTTAWLLWLRRRPNVTLGAREQRVRGIVEDEVRHQRALLTGAVRQELLSGIRDSTTFDLLRVRLRAIEDTPAVTGDYERAAASWNALRTHGVAGGKVDMLICAIAERLNVPILTTDPDFERYAAHLPITLHELSRRDP